MVNLNPQKLDGVWTSGYALDIHTIKSEFIGYDENDLEQYKTDRTDLGQLIYQLKYKSDPGAINIIVDTIIEFLSGTWKIDKEINYILPVPPSKTNRLYQPVIEISKRVSSKTCIPLASECLVKIKDTPQLKGVFDLEKRKEILRDAFNITQESLSLIKDKNILLIDDLFRSGATLDCATNTLFNKGKAKKVFVLAITKTRILK